MNRLLDLARYLKSDQNGVLICLIGTLVQSFHTYSIVYYSSQLEMEWMKHLQAILAGFFFSLGLVMYTFRAGSISTKKPDGTTDYENKRLQDRYKYYARGFAVFEIFVNIHYWTRYFIIDKLSKNIELTIMDYYDWSIALIYSFFLPFFIASYAGHIKVPDIKISDLSFIDKLKTTGLYFKVEKNIMNKNEERIVKLKQDDSRE